MKRSPIFTAAFVLAIGLLAGTRLLSGRFPSLWPRQVAAKDESVAPRAAEEAVRSSKAEKLLSDAREKLIAYRSIHANIVARVSISERPFKLAGEYTQGRDLQLRLELNTRVGETTGSLLEVCDGNILWIRRSIGESHRTIRRDVRQILAKVQSSKAIPENMLIGDLGIGGLPGLLAALEQAFRYHDLRKETYNGKEFAVIEGSWRKEFLEKVADDKQRPAYVPDAVRIYFDRETLFPKRLLYLKQTDGGEFDRLVTIDLSNIRLNGTLREDEFQFSPVDKVGARDDTQTFINRMID